jgi:preprotein translocase subunit SecA
MIDMQWREHLMHLDHLRQVIGLRGYGQRDPLNEYKTEAFALFEKLLVDLRQNVTRWVMTVEFRFEQPAQPFATEAPEMVEVHLDPLTGENERAVGAGFGGFGDLSKDERERLPVTALPGGWEKTPRNAPCPCGSDKKFKHCHGALI